MRSEKRKIVFSVFHLILHLTLVHPQKTCCGIRQSEKRGGTQHLTEGKTRSCGAECKRKREPKPRPIFRVTTIGDRGATETSFGK